MILAPALLFSRTRDYAEQESAIRLGRGLIALAYCSLLLASCLLCLPAKTLYRQEAEAMVHKPLHIDALSRVADAQRSPAQKRGAQSRAQNAKQSTGFEGKLQELLNDPMLREGNLGAVQKLLDMDASLFSESGDDATPFEDALLGSMNLMNAEAIATVSHMLEEKARREGKTGLSAMPDEARSLAQLVTTKPVGSPLASVRMPLNRTPLNTASLDHGVSSMPGNPSVRMALEGMPVDLMGVMLATVQEGNMLPGAMPAATASPDMHRAMAAYAKAAPAAPQAAAPPTQPAQPAQPKVAPVQPKVVAETKEPEKTIRPAKPYRAPRLDVTGVIAAKFESGHHGIAAIGYDRRGGTSYGKYQISSQRGSMREFIRFLDRRAPDMADRLRSCGRANTGGRSGEMPMEWKRIAAEHPRRFRDLQDEFIHRANYRPALQNILEETNINIGNSSPALREVLWSTAVQHGPKGAADIFVNATRLASVTKEHTTGTLPEKKLIEAVYDERKGRFHGSSRRIRHAVRTRLEREKHFALSLLSNT